MLMLYKFYYLHIISICKHGLINIIYNYIILNVIFRYTTRIDKYGGGVVLYINSK